jgi:hypothetical protein
LKEVIARACFRQDGFSYCDSGRLKTFLLWTEGFDPCLAGIEDNARILSEKTFSFPLPGLGKTSHDRHPHDKSWGYYLSSRWDPDWATAKMLVLTLSLVYKYEA